jgi:hypothetical protein
MTSPARPEVGASSLEVAQSIVSSNEEVAAVRLFSHPVTSTWRHDFPDAAGQIRHVSRALSYVSGDLPSVRLERREFLAMTLDDLLGGAANEALSLSSSVDVVSGATMNRAHLDLMNLTVDEGLDFEDLVSALQAIQDSKTGYLLESGRHFHYYGSDLISSDHWPAYMGRFLLHRPLVSFEYIGYRLIAGSCALRLNAVPPKKPLSPRLVRVLSRRSMHSQ